MILSCVFYCKNLPTTDDLCTLESKKEDTCVAAHGDERKRGGSVTGQREKNLGRTLCLHHLPERGGRYVRELESHLQGYLEY